MFSVRKSCAQSTLVGLREFRFDRFTRCTYRKEHSPNRCVYANNTRAATNGQCFFSPVHSFIFIYFFIYFLCLSFGQTFAASHNRVECVSVERVVKLLGNIFRINTLLCLRATTLAYPWSVECSIYWLLIFSLSTCPSLASFTSVSSKKKIKIRIRIQIVIIWISTDRRRTVDECWIILK